MVFINRICHLFTSVMVDSTNTVTVSDEKNSSGERTVKLCHSRRNMYFITRYTPRRGEVTILVDMIGLYYVKSQRSTSRPVHSGVCNK